MAGKIKNYKGFDKDLKCRGFQYVIGQSYTEKEAKACDRGFHACRQPIEVFGYYPPGTSRHRWICWSRHRWICWSRHQPRILCSRGSSAAGENGLSVARGNNVKVKGGLGAVLVIAEENGGDYDIKEWKAAVVDGETIKADTWYRLKDGEFEEVSENA